MHPVANITPTKVRTESDARHSRPASFPQFVALVRTTSFVTLMELNRYIRQTGEGNKIKRILTKQSNVCCRVSLQQMTYVTDRGGGEVRGRPCTGSPLLPYSCRVFIAQVDLMLRATCAGYRAPLSLQAYGLRTIIVVFVIIIVIIPCLLLGPRVLGAGLR